MVECVVLNEMATLSIEEPIPSQGEEACRLSSQLLTSLMDIVIKHSFHEQKQQERSRSRLPSKPTPPLNESETVCVVNWEEIADSPEYETFFHASTKLKYVRLIVYC